MRTVKRKTGECENMKEEKNRRKILTEGQ